MPGNASTIANITVTDSDCAALHADSAVPLRGAFAEQRKAINARAGKRAWNPVDPP